MQERRATVTDAAAERLRGLLDQAVSVVQTSLSSPEADPRLAMALLSALGVLERGRSSGKRWSSRWLEYGSARWMRMGTLNG